VAVSMTPSTAAKRSFALVGGRRHLMRSADTWTIVAMCGVKLHQDRVHQLGGVWLVDGPHAWPTTCMNCYGRERETPEIPYEGIDRFYQGAPPTPDDVVACRRWALEDALRALQQGASPDVDLTARAVEHLQRQLGVIDEG